jgi:hypothetical protein
MVQRNNREINTTPGGDAGGERQVLNGSDILRDGSGPTGNVQHFDNYLHMNEAVLKTLNRGNAMLENLDNVSTEDLRAQIASNDAIANSVRAYMTVRSKELGDAITNAQYA